MKWTLYVKHNSNLKIFAIFIMIQRYTVDPVSLSYLKFNKLY